MKNFSHTIIGLLLAGQIFAQVPELKVNVGHTDNINSVCFSPDDRYVASGSEDNTIKLWDFTTGKELKTFTDTDKIYSVSFSADGKYIVSGGRAGAKLWNIQSGAVTKLSEVETQIAELSSDGKYAIATASYEGKIMLIPTTPGEKKKFFVGHAGYLWCAKFSPDGKYFASGCDDKTIRLWNISTGLAVKTFRGHTGDVRSIAFSPNGKYIASGGTTGDNTVKIWDIATGKALKTLKGHENAVESVCFSPDGKYVISGSYDGTIRFWDVATGNNLKTYPEYFLENVLSIDISSDGKYLASGNGNKTIRIFDISTDKSIALWPGDKLEITDAFFSADGQAIINTNIDINSSENGGMNQSLKLWSWSDAEKVKKHEGISSLMEKVNSMYGDLRILAHSGNRKNVVCCYSIGGVGNIALFDAKTNECIKTLGLNENIYGITMAALSDDSKVLAIGFSNNTIKVWNIENGMTLMSSFAGYKTTLEAINLSPDGKFVVAGGEDEYPNNPIKVWSVADGKKLMSLNGHQNGINAVSFAPDGKCIASASCDGYIKIWDVATKKMIKNIGGNKSMISSVAFSADGKYLVSGHYLEEFTVKLWDLSTGQQLKAFNGHVGKVKSVQFSADGNYVVSSSDDGSVKIWNVTTGKCMVSRYDVPNSSDWVAVTPDGRFDGTDSGLKLLYYVKNLEIIPLESFYERFYTPGLVAQVMSGSSETSYNLATIGTDIKLPPRVRIVSPTINDKFSTDEVNVVIEATDQGGGIDEIRLYQNGKLVSEEQRGMKPALRVGETLTKQYTISLLSGNNELKATAFNNDRTESTPFTLNIELSKAIASSNLYVLSIGINRYKNEKYTLTYSSADAEGFTQAISTKSKAIFKNINTTILKDEQCTKEGILSYLNSLSKEIKPEDVFIFYYAGHGVMSEGAADRPSEFYFVPYDVTQLYGNDELLYAKGISASELRKALVSIKAQKQLIVMDACQSGGATEMLAMRGAAEEKALMQLARSAGIAVLSSTGTEQFATEVKQLGHGIFTYSLLEGLNGKADGGTKDGKITIKELAAFIEDNVPELTKQYRGTVQYPSTSIRGMDFPIVVSQ